MFVYGDFIEPNVLEGINLLSRTKEETFGPTITRLDDLDTDDLIQEDDVHIVLWHKNFLHAFFNMVSYILFFFNKNKDAHFLIILGIDVHEGDLEIPHSKFILNMLTNKKVRYRLVNIKNETVKVKDAKYFHTVPFQSSFVDDVYDYCSGFVDRSKKPDKVIYLARSKVKPKEEGSIFYDRDRDTLVVKNDLRIEDEEKLVEFFIENGIEIVYPEDFKNFGEQVKFLNNVRVMICPSGSGMANMIFMQPGGIVVELQTPVVVGAKQQVHPFYASFCWVKKHIYITIPHERKSDTIIDIFTNRRLLDYL